MKGFRSDNDAIVESIAVFIFLPSLRWTGEIFTDEKTGNEIPEDNRLLKSFENQRNDGRSHENKPQIVNEVRQMWHDLLATTSSSLIL